MEFSLSRPQLLRYARVALLITLPVVIVTAGLLLWWTSAPLDAPDAAAGSAALEEQWGIQIRQVGVTADGGLIDLRYLVTDSEKATRMFSDLRTTPLIYASDGTAIQLRTLIKHHHTLEVGRTYYMLYRNSGNVITPGSLVSIQVGDVQLRGVVAR